MRPTIFENIIMILLSFMLVVSGSFIIFGCNKDNSKPNGVIVVQYRADGTIFNCWSLKNQKSFYADNGIYWRDDNDNFFYIAGASKISVNDGDFDSAAKQLGIDLKKCPGGKYNQE